MSTSSGNIGRSCPQVLLQVHLGDEVRTFLFEALQHLKLASGHEKLKYMIVEQTGAPVPALKSS